jgi:hypothetical protein
MERLGAVAGGVFCAAAVIVLGAFLVKLAEEAQPCATYVNRYNFLDWIIAGCLYLLALGCFLGAVAIVAGSFVVSFAPSLPTC